MGWAYTLEELAFAIGADKPEGAGGHVAEFQSVSTDTRTLAGGEVFFALRGPNFDGSQFVTQAFAKGACAAVTTAPNPAGPCLIVDDPLQALQALAAHHRNQFNIPVIAVTGSCGKTLSKDLAAALLASRHTVAKTFGNFNNEVGCPLSLLQINSATDIAVIEMGANHLGEIGRLCALARPTESAITMVAAAHLEGFGTVENVARAKAEVIEALPANGLYYVNADDEWCMRIAESFPGETILFGSSGDVVLEDCRFDESGEMRLRVTPVGELRLPLHCRAHATNVLLAVAVGLRHGVDEFEGPLRECCATATRFKVVKLGPLEVIDDTYNANPASMAAALDTLANRPRQGARIAALGEMLELGSAAGDLHRRVGEMAGKAGVTHLFAKGPHAADMIDGARAMGVTHAEVIDDHKAIAEAIRRVARPGNVVLVKGSRRIEMERVIEALRAQYDERDR